MWLANFQSKFLLVNVSDAFLELSLVITFGGFTFMWIHPMILRATASSLVMMKPGQKSPQSSCLPIFEHFSHHLVSVKCLMLLQ